MTRSFLITGCGGDIALSIASILRDSLPSARLVGADIHDRHPGCLVYDSVTQLPRADNRKYLQSLRSLINDEAIDVLLPTSEAELSRLFAEQIDERLDKATVVMANRKALEVGLDKKRTYETLAEAGLPRPWTHRVGDSPPREVPCIIKARHSQGSKSVAIVEEPLVAYYRNFRPDDIFQEYLSEEDAEFTCGLFRASGMTRSISFQRVLNGGTTGYGVVVHDEVIDALLVQVADAIDLEGSINVQLRLSSQDPVIFEINPRFSSTVAFRHHLGFKDLLWSIEAIDRLPLSEYRAPPEGTQIFRGSKEYIMPPQN